MDKDEKQPRGKLFDPLSLKVNDEIILMILREHSEIYGLDMLDALNRDRKKKREVKLGTLYSTLTRLEKNGLVSTRWGEEVVEGERGARRKYYKITGLGAQALSDIARYRASFLPSNLALSVWNRGFAI